MSCDWEPPGTQGKKGKLHYLDLLVRSESIPVYPKKLFYLTLYSRTILLWNYAWCEQRH